MSFCILISQNKEIYKKKKIEKKKNDTAPGTQALHLETVEALLEEVSNV
jgi:hypothetical protein